MSKLVYRWVDKNEDPRLTNALFELERQTNVLAPSSEAFHQSLSAPAWMCAYALETQTGSDGELPIGLCRMQVITDHAHIAWICVSERARRKGYGFDFLQSVMRDLEGKGVRSVTLEVRRSNFQAIALYTKSGFTLCGTRPSYYTNPREDALVYEIKL